MYPKSSSVSYYTTAYSEKNIIFFFNDTATTEIYTLSLHDALPICHAGKACGACGPAVAGAGWPQAPQRSEEHTSELQSHLNLVCRLLLEKKKRNQLGMLMMTFCDVHLTMVQIQPLSRKHAPLCTPS